MPTGYTQELMEKGEEFKPFIMRCIRAMGVCIDMRDDSMDATIPEKFEPSDYHQKAVDKARAELKKLRYFSKKEQIAFGENKLENSKKSNEKYLKQNLLENKRLEDMEAKIRNWKISDQYISFKKFMLDQLEISKNHTDYYENYKYPTPMEYYQEALSGAARDIEYYTKQMEEERKRYDEKNAYLKGLREAVEGIE